MVYHDGESIEKANISQEKLKAHILRKLARHRIWGNKHTPLVYARSGLPKETEADAEEAAKSLANEGMITWLPKTGQIHISLNPAKRKEIVQLIEKYYGNEGWL